jgi:hypothetical protein
VTRWWQALMPGPRLPVQHRTANATFVAVGYPKVGNTWLRITLGNYLAERYALASVPLMDAAEFDTLAAAGARAIGEFTHRPLEWTGQTANDLSYETVVGPFLASPVVLLARYPLDTIVSLFMQERFRNPQSPFEGSIADFIDHPVFGIEKLIRFHRLWDEARHDAKVLLWRYEDALADALREVARVLAFLGEPVDHAMAARAVEKASFENLRALEVSGRQPRYQSSNLPIFATGDPANQNALHNRRGVAGGYRDEIPAALIPGLEDRIAREMPAWFGYQVPPPPQS